MGGSGFPSAHLKMQEYLIKRRYPDIATELPGVISAICEKEQAEKLAELISNVYSCDHAYYVELFRTLEKT